MPGTQPGSGQDQSRARCGHSTELIRTFQSGAVEVKLPNGQTRSYLPLYLNNKTRFNCTAIKVRIACVLAVRESAEGVTLQLSSEPRGGFYNETVSVRADGSIVYADNNLRFALVPDRRDLLEKSLSEFKCSSGSNCDYQRRYSVERRMLEILRNARPMKSRVELSQRRRERIEFEKSFERLSAFQSLYHSVIVTNEIGSPKDKSPMSPYQLVDAVYGNSGASFGAHQIDIGANPEKDQNVFRRIMERYWKAQSPGGHGTLLNFVARKRFEKPIRAFDIGTMANFYKHVPLMNVALQSPEGRAIYASFYRNYLAESERRAAGLERLGGLFRHSVVARLYALDVHNQYPASVYQGLVTLAVGLTPDRQRVAEAEEKLRNHMLNTSFGRTRSSDVNRRFDNIREIAKRQSAGM